MAQSPPVAARYFGSCIHAGYRELMRAITLRSGQKIVATGWVHSQAVELRRVQPGIALAERGGLRGRGRVCQAAIAAEVRFVGRARGREHENNGVVVGVHVVRSCHRVAPHRFFGPSGRSSTDVGAHVQVETAHVERIRIGGRNRPSISSNKAFWMSICAMN